MSAVSLPVTRPSGRALLIASPASRASTQTQLEGLGYACDEVDDPYTATAALAKRPGAYRAVVVSLSSLYREELTVISTLRRRYPGTEVWLTHTDGRQAALAEAMRMGADGLLADDGLHRIGIASPPPPAEPEISQHESETAADDMEFSPGEPVLTADELRALLQEQPSLPPGEG
jgi:CheY-like chemotaxis protein